LHHRPTGSGFFTRQALGIGYGAFAGQHGFVNIGMDAFQMHAQLFQQFATTRAAGCQVNTGIAWGHDVVAASVINIYELQG
jgi:hypothetical protein